MGKKFYVVHCGRETGVFSNWPTAEEHIIGYSGAKHQSFKTRAAADKAFAEYVPPVQPKAQAKGSAFRLDDNYDIHIFCDGACVPNPGEAGSGVVEYQSGKLSGFYHGLYSPDGTNNTAELEALYEAMRWLRRG